MDDRDELDGETQTTAAGVIRLASVIAALVREGTVDTRFGGKLFKRIDKEAKRVAENDETGRDAIVAALGELDLALRQHDAASLVEANARLRDREDAAGKRRKGKKD